MNKRMTTSYYRSRT